VTSSHAPEGAGLPASQSTFGFSTGLNSTQSAPATLLSQSKFDFTGYMVQATDLYSRPSESEG
jgi:hypothetical protein